MLLLVVEEVPGQLLLIATEEATESADGGHQWFLDHHRDRRDQSAGQG